MRGIAVVTLILMGGTSALVLKALWLRLSRGSEPSLLIVSLCCAGAGLLGMILSRFGPSDMTNQLQFFAGADLMVSMAGLLFSLRKPRR